MVPKMSGFGAHHDPFTDAYAETDHHYSEPRRFAAAAPSSPEPEQRARPVEHTTPRTFAEPQVRRYKCLMQ